MHSKRRVHDGHAMIDVTVTPVEASRLIRACYDQAEALHRTADERATTSPAAIAARDEAETYERLALCLQAAYR